MRLRIVGDTEVLLELIDDLKDRLSVHERTGETVTPAELKADLASTARDD